MKTEVIACVIIGLLVSEAKAQPTATLARDPLTGLYAITYTDESGIVHRVQFQGRAEVAPEMTLTLNGHDGVAVYNYKIGNGKAARQPMLSVSLACEPTTVGAAGAANIQLWSSVRAGRPGPLVYYCRSTLIDPTNALPGVPPGHQYVFRPVALQSRWLPGIREALARGAAELPLFPGFRDEASETIHELLKSTQSPLQFMTVSPKYPPEAFADPAGGVVALLDELTQACSLGWVSPDGICNSLRVKLEHAQAAASAGDRKATAQHLETYASELRAQSGKHVAEMFANAMIFDVEFMLGSLR